MSRRVLVKGSAFGLLAASIPNVLYSRSIRSIISDLDLLNESPHERYPAIKLEIAREVVGVAHFNLDRLRELVNPRPELAKANWDWGYGDWESAIGAATHVGRNDIIEYLILQGAVPTIFTYAVLGDLNTVKTMIESYPGIQKNLGPHGISLLQHAKTALESEGVDKANAQRLVEYLQSLGDPDGKQYLELAEAEKAKFLGDYIYGEGKDDGFTIKLNMRNLLSLGKLGKSGGALLCVAENEFVYQGAPSVIVNFIVHDGNVTSITVAEPGLTLSAKKV